MRIKICGVTTPADAELAACCGADAVGLNFYARSPRYLDPARARAVLAVLPPFVEPVGLFVNTSLDDVRAASSALGLRTLQLHGDVPPALPGDGFRYVVCFALRDAAGLAAIDRYLAAQRPAAILVDAHVAGAYGGTGQCAPWDLLEKYRPAVPLILAGGLTPDNVAAAIRRVRPYAVDVASGVESSPGIKDPERVRRFIDAARQA